MTKTKTSGLGMQLRSSIERRLPHHLSGSGPHLALPTVNRRALGAADDLRARIGHDRNALVLFRSGTSKRLYSARQPSAWCLRSVEKPRIPSIPQPAAGRTPSAMRTLLV